MASRPMGRLLLVFRLVVGDIKRRPVQSAMLAVMILTTTTTLTLGLALRHVTEGPFARTRAATRGPDAIAELQPNPGAHGSPTRPFALLRHAPGVEATAEFPLAFVHLRAPGVDVPVNAEGRTAARSAINQPLVTAGHWVAPGEVVLEKGLAAALGLHLGDRVMLRGRSFRVGGIAVETEQAFYPVCTPGLVWVTPADAAGLATRADPIGYELDIKLAHPADGIAFGNSAAVIAWASATFNESSGIEPWEQVREEDYRAVTIDQKAMLIGSWLLAMLAIASIAVVVGGRLAEQTRRVGLLKAVGATPWLVAAVLLAENLLLALTGAAAGLLVGWALLPTLANPGSGLLGSTPLPSITLVTIVEVIAAAIAVAAAATALPAVRGARASTIGALTDPIRPPKRRARLIALSSRLPVPILLGLRLVSRRVRRTILTALSLTIAVAMATAAATLQHQVDVKQQTHYPTGLFQSTEVATRVGHVVVVLAVILVVLACLTAIFTAWATVVDAERPTALARALGATPRQVSGGVTTAQLLPALLAACVGVPAGLGLFELAGGHVAKASPPALLLLAVIPCTLLLVGIVTAIPARLGARRPVAGVLRAE